MANELAENIYKMSIQFDESENSSFIKIKIDKDQIIEVNLIKTRKYVIINNFKILKSNNFDKLVKQLWKYILNDKINVYCITNNLPIENRHIGIGWYKDKNSSLMLFESNILCDKIIDFLTFISNPDILIC